MARKRTEIRNAVAMELATSTDIAAVSIYRVYPFARLTDIPAVNIITGAESVVPEDQILNGYLTRTMDLIFEVFSYGTSAGDEIDEIDLEIESLLAADDTAVDALMTDGHKTVTFLYPDAFDEPEILNEGDEPIIKTRIHYVCKYVEKLGG